MLEESKRMSEHIIEITELKLRRVGGGRDGKGRENAGKNAEASIGEDQLRYRAAPGKSARVSL